MFGDERVGGAARCGDRDVMRHIRPQTRESVRQAFDKNSFTGKLRPEIFEDVQDARLAHQWSRPAPEGRSANATSGARIALGNDARRSLRRCLKSSPPLPTALASDRTR